MKPIIFSSESIRAIQANKKDQTRRIVKPPAPWDPCDYGLDIEFHTGNIKCPYGVPGDTLWVRETFFHDGTDEPSALHFRANASEADEAWFKEEGWKWKPSIYMKKEYARIFLEITKVRVERVQDITDDDCRAEGITGLGGMVGANTAMLVTGTTSIEDAEIVTLAHGFIGLWDSIHAKPKPKKRGGVITHYESYPWEDIQETREFRGLPWRVFGNPWTWPIDFKQIGGTK